MENNTDLNKTNDTGGGSSGFPLNALLLLICIIAAGAVLTLLTFNKFYPAAKEAIPVQQIKKPAGTPKASVLPLESVNMPLDSSKSYVGSFDLIYNFEGKLLNIKDSDGRKELITDITGKNIPGFVINANTKFFTISNDGSFKEAKLEDLKQNQKIRLSSFYSFKDNRWFLGFVYIYDI
ncbi:hypothetical protein A2858_02735 [Candidatus Daviesbacteria bacterium RIFCSPHIGHO2_01_FULL_36_37]|uniref:Uncharacterized protein n=3 Tax=Candidatus Daviesiibacteriota TaxID=1752718 RepID=A0A1F5IMU5_9BACT|nr:MAG: hypothetical protein US28_C0020G0009 [Candidatus Daviesbacteria bacterium GW2011_GWA1_36_8]OGE17639.1 MAG: hypothetical protein A2858_02735 [Candidatus Daviesbacteria bacterium RIFCSPHIGHO2_01_FULL_36_37]